LVPGVCPTPSEDRRALDGTKVELLGEESGRNGDEPTLGAALRRWDVGEDGVDGGLDMVIQRCHRSGLMPIMAVFEVLDHFS
jgi:hypothetical protein